MVAHRIDTLGVIFLLLLLFSSCNPSAQFKVKEAGRENHGGEGGEHIDSLNLLKGKAFIKQLEFDSARVYLLKSAESKSILLSTESYLYLNSIEVRSQNYDAALHYLNRYHENAISLFERALNMEQKVREQQETAQSMQRQDKARLRAALLFSGVLLTLILVIIYFQQKKLFIFSKHKKAELKKLDSLIHIKKEEKKSVGYKAYLLQADVFMQTPVYRYIKRLESQRGSEQEIGILTYEKQDHLQIELDRIFADFRNDLEKCGARLTINDIKLCCLSLLPISTLAKAICFGSSETSIIKQRKHYIKKKMTKESNNALLFDFIFTPRH